MMSGAEVCCLVVTHSRRLKLGLEKLGFVLLIKATDLRAQQCKNRSLEHESDYQFGLVQIKNCHFALGTVSIGLLVVEIQTVEVSRCLLELQVNATVNLRTFDQFEVDS